MGSILTVIWQTLLGKVVGTVYDKAIKSKEDDIKVTTSTTYIEYVEKPSAEKEENTK